MNILIAFSLGALFGAILMVVVAVILIDEKNQRGEVQADEHRRNH